MKTLKESILSQGYDIDDDVAFGPAKDFIKLLRQAKWDSRAGRSRTVEVPIKLWKDIMNWIFESRTSKDYTSAVLWYAGAGRNYGPNKFFPFKIEVYNTNYSKKFVLEYNRFASNTNLNISWVDGDDSDKEESNIHQQYIYIPKEAYTVLECCVLKNML
jgi:hypothetical protein